MENDFLTKKEIEKLNKLSAAAQKTLIKNPTTETLFVRFKRNGERLAARFYIRMPQNPEEAAKPGAADANKSWIERYVSKEEVFKNIRLINSYCAQEVILLATKMLKRKTGDVTSEFQALFGKFYEAFGTMTPKEYLPNTVMMQMWADQQPAPSFRVEELVHQTIRGEKVRSKFEKMAADVLFTSGFYYQYERPLLLSGKTIFPDFTIIDPNAGGYIILEALGKLDDRNYICRNLEKLKLYEENGYYIGEKLMIIFDNPTAPFDTELFRSQLINRFGLQTHGKAI